MFVSQSKRVFLNCTLPYFQCANKNKNKNTEILATNLKLTKQINSKIRISMSRHKLDRLSNFSVCFPWKNGKTSNFWFILINLCSSHDIEVANFVLMWIATDRFSMKICFQNKQIDWNGWLFTVRMYHSFLTKEVVKFYVISSCVTNIKFGQNNFTAEASFKLCWIA